MSPRQQRPQVLPVEHPDEVRHVAASSSEWYEAWLERCEIDVASMKPAQ